MKVSKKFLKEYVDSIYAFGGQIDLESILAGKHRVIDTTLTKNMINDIVLGNSTIKEFNVLIDVGWGQAWVKNYRNEDLRKYIDDETDNDL